MICPSCGNRLLPGSMNGGPKVLSCLCGFVQTDTPYATSDVRYGPPPSSQGQKRGNGPVPTEHEEQVAFFARLGENIPAHPELELIFAIPNAGGFSGGYKENVVRVQKLKEEGVKPGVPDIFVPIPILSNEQYEQIPGLFIEMKRQSAVPSDVKQEQRERHEHLRQQGYRVEVCRGAEEAWRVLMDYLSPLRGMLK